MSDLIKFNYQNIRFFVFSKAQVEEMIEATSLNIKGDIPSDVVIFKKMAESALVRLGKNLSQGSAADHVEAIVSWPKSGSIEGVILEIHEKWKVKKIDYLDALK